MFQIVDLLLDFYVYYTSLFNARLLHDPSAENT